MIAYPNQFHEYVGTHKVLQAVKSSFGEVLLDTILKNATFFIKRSKDSSYFCHFWSCHYEKQETTSIS